MVRPAKKSGSVTLNLWSKYINKLKAKIQYEKPGKTKNINLSIHSENV